MHLDSELTPLYLLPSKHAALSPESKHTRNNLGNVKPFCVLPISMGELSTCLSLASTNQWTLKCIILGGLYPPLLRYYSPFAWVYHFQLLEREGVASIMICHSQKCFQFPRFLCTVVKSQKCYLTVAHTVEYQNAHFTRAAKLKWKGSKSIW